MASIYLDTNAFIRCFESGLADAKPLQHLFKALRSRPDAAVTSELTIAELFAPVKRLDADLLLRESFAPKLPGAIRVVTAVAHGCRLFMSHDGDVARLPSPSQSVLPDAAGVQLCLAALAVQK